ncbi:MAG: phenylacetic acid degradation b [Cyclobacteriaceae bacterium]|nr:phenylacetic acid degradation b [Cyclobacteriaceae bacterium]
MFHRWPDSTMASIDPRVNRLPEIGKPGLIQPKAPLDQLGTFEVFVQPKEGKPFQHEGSVHAPDTEMAFVLAKETFTRRFTCSSLYVVDTRDVYVSPITEGDRNVYELIHDAAANDHEKYTFEIYHLNKRGKQHTHAGTVSASSHEGAMAKAKQQFNSDKIIYNIWSIRTDTIRFTAAEEMDLWLTLPEKKFRDAADYKGGEKLKEFLKKTNHA